MTLAEEFQGKWGTRWAGIAADPSFTDALLTVNASLLDEIKRLTPEQTASPMGNIVLARLQGALYHEDKLIELATVLPDISSSDLGPETYRDEFAGDEQEQAEDEMPTEPTPLKPSLAEEFAREQQQSKPKRKYVRKSK